MLDPWGVSPPRMHRLVAQTAGQDDLGPLASSIGHHAIEGLWWVESVFDVELFRVHAPTRDPDCFRCLRLLAQQKWSSNMERKSLIKSTVRPPHCVSFIKHSPCIMYEDINLWHLESHDALIRRHVDYLEFSLPLDLFLSCLASSLISA